MLVAEMLVDSAAGFEYLSMLDGYSGYNQIYIAEEDVSKTAFRFPWALGCYEWIMMPFGLKNDGACYQRAINSMFHDFIGMFMQVTMITLLSNLLLKCAFGVRAGDFLGFVVHKKGIEINQNKTKAILETKLPSTKERTPILIGENQLS
jgi:hypothetical protein